MDIKEFFKTLPFNTSQIYGRVHIIDSNCTLYFPGEKEDIVKANKDMLDEYFNGNGDLLVA